MKRPEKIHDLYADKNDCAIWNNCCDKWEKFLPSEDEIKKILMDCYGKDSFDKEAKALSKRLEVK